MIIGLSAVGFVWPKRLLGSFGQNAGRRIVGPSILRCSEVRKVRKGPLPRRRRQGGGAFRTFRTFRSIGAACRSHGSNRMHCGRTRLGASATAHDPKPKPLARSTVAIEPVVMQAGRQAVGVARTILAKQTESVKVQ